MRARNLTLTGIGLPVRAELRLKSLLEVVNAKTTDRWSFVEQGDAHVAICDPASALSSVTMKRSASARLVSSRWSKTQRSRWLAPQPFEIRFVRPI